MKTDNKKSKKLFIIGLVTLLVAFIGATYAYFLVQTSTSFNSSTINSNLGSLGSVSLAGSEASLTLSLNRSDMKEANTGKYYASTTGKKTTPTMETIATATVANNDTGYYHCTYTLSVSHTGTSDMYDRFNHQTNNSYDYTNRTTNQVKLLINDDTYDWASEGGMPSTINGSFNIKAGRTIYIKAGLEFTNLNQNQNYLAGSDITITIGLVANSFTCTVLPTPQPNVKYWTFEGTEALFTSTHKISDYRNLNVWKRTYNDAKYTYPNETQCNNAIIGSETCSQVLQPFFIKETTIEDISTATIYELLVSTDNGNTFNTAIYYDENQIGDFMEMIDNNLDCDGSSVAVIGEEGYKYKCVTHSAGYTYNNQNFEVCMNINGTEACLDKNANLENIASYSGTFTNAGYTCEDLDDGYVCSNTGSNNGEFDDGALLCLIDEGGSVECAIKSEALCVISGPIIGCGTDD